MLSKLFHPHRSPQTSFAPLVFFSLIAAFTLMISYRPVVGLAGLGATVILASALVIANRKRIMDDYKKSYKKRNHPKGPWYEPRDSYYLLNIWVVWPGVAVLGALCLWAAWNLG